METVTVLAIFATIAGIAMAFSQLFQAIKIFRKKSALEISAPTYIILGVGSFIWILYGVAIKSFPIIIANGIGIIIIIIVLIGCVLYGNKQNK